MNTNENRQDCILFVDLDGTLIRTDLLLESFLGMIKTSPWVLFLVPFWLLRGKAYLKQQIALRADIDATTLPYHEAFVEYLREEKTGGRHIYLATASHARLAQSVANHLGLFRGVLATENENLKGLKKLQAIRQTAGDKCFDYAGNEHADLAIWAHCDTALIVNARRSVEQDGMQLGVAHRVFPRNKINPLLYLAALRPHQWVKNVLLFVPLVASHSWQSWNAIGLATLAFMAFCLIASSVYLLNDLLDLPADRQHPRKRHRPFASGQLSLLYGLAMSPVLLLLGLAISLLVSPAFVAVVAGYYLATSLYTWTLKSYALIDVITLAGLYTLRILAGAVAITVTPSFWLLAFSMFVFLSLALIKRITELKTLAQAGQEVASGRDYRVSDFEYLHSMGTASGYLAVLVIPLYLNTPEVAAQYRHPEWLWLVCPLLLYWISRLWLKAGRGEMHDDPIVFTIRDRGSRYVVGAILLVFVLAL